jgi:hypothetical protein
LKNLKGRDHTEDLGVDGSVTLERNLGKWGGKVWINLAQDRDKWWALVNTIITFGSM